MDVLKRLAMRAGTGADIALAAAMAGAIAFNAALTARTGSGWPFGAGVGVVICGTALLRARNRALAAVAGLIMFALAGFAAALGAVRLGPLFGGGLAGLLVLGAAAIRALPLRAAAAIGAAGTAIIGIAETAGPSGFFDHRVLWALAGMTAWFAALVVGLYLRYLDFLHRQALDTARREERLDLARELHDVVAHHVTGIVVQAQAARFAAQSDTMAMRLALDSIQTAGTDTLTAIRRVVGLLRDPEDPASVGPPEPISELVQRFAEHGPRVDLRLPVSAPAASWPPEVAGTVYRIVQEALTNVARHAPGARSVTVAVSEDSRQVKVEVTDDGPGARHPRPGGYGLVGMRERVEALGGELCAGPVPGAGWAVQASVPVVLPART